MIYHYVGRWNIDIIEQLRSFIYSIAMETQLKVYVPEWKYHGQSCKKVLTILGLI